MGGLDEGTGRLEARPGTRTRTVARAMGLARMDRPEAVPLDALGARLPTREPSRHRVRIHLFRPQLSVAWPIGFCKGRAAVHEGRRPPQSGLPLARRLGITGFRFRA